MRIDRAYKGISEKTVALFDDGMCDGPSLRVGEQYLMYTHPVGEGYLAVRGCTRSRHVTDADEDLKYLNGRSTAPPTATILGQVTIRPDVIGSPDQPASGVLVEIQGERRARTTTTDSQGRYTFDGLKPGRYSVSARQPGFSMSRGESDEPYDVEARGCGVMDVVLRQVWSGTLGGRVTRLDGTPGPPGIVFGLIRVEGTDKSQKPGLLLHSIVQTDGHGEYSFHGIPPGRYRVVMNLYVPPSPKNPYPTIYWPGARTEAGASEVEVGSAVSWPRCDFQLPVELKSKLVGGVLLLPDGQPAKRQLVNVVPLHNAVSEPVTDAAGRFSFTAMEGFDYSLVAALSGDLTVVSDVVHYSFGEDSQSVTLKLVQRKHP
ncbi:MAG: collagen binding domain-containing protein [Bryobacteraceae bacterium]